MSSFLPPPADRHALEEGTAFTPRFDEAGLITCVTIAAASREVLMLAHMNDEALRLTLETGVAHYWSRSRRSLWKKGETSGALQRVKALRVDCDQDALVLEVEVDRPEDTCHTRRPTCFYRVVASPDGALRLLSEPARD